MCKYFWLYGVYKNRFTQHFMSYPLLVTFESITLKLESISLVNQGKVPIIEEFGVPNATDPH